MNRRQRKARVAEQMRRIRSRWPERFCLKIIHAGTDGKVECLREPGHSGLCSAMTGVDAERGRDYRQGDSHGS